MNIEVALRAAIAILEHNFDSNARLDAELLLCHVLGQERAFLFAHPEYELDPGQTADYLALVKGRAAGRPVQYLTGTQEFWGLEFRVTPATLIPRPETEHLVETAVAIARGYSTPRVLDVGTGSGCIAVAIAHELPGAEVHAVDISLEALSIARENANRLLRADRVRFTQSDLLTAADGKFDLIVSNPPYVGESEPDKVQKQVRDYEPHVAVFGGWTGIEIYARLIPQARESLNAKGWLLLEIGYSIEDRVVALLEGFRHVRTVADLQGIPRVVIAQRAD